MKLTPETESSGFGYILEHNDMQVFIPASSLARARKGLDEPWKALEGFLNAQGDDALMDLYSLLDESESLIDIEDIDELKHKARSIINRIDAKFDANKFDYFYSSGMIHIPDGLSENEDLYNSEEFYRDRTYSTMEYRNIALLSLQLRLYTPVIGVVLDNMTKSKLNLADVQAWALFSETSLWEHPAIPRLLRYIKAITKEHMSKTNEASISLMSGSMMAPHLQAQVLFRKLIHYDILDKDMNIVSYIYRYVDAQPKALQRQAGGEIRQHRSLADGEEGKKFGNRLNITSQTTIADETIYAHQARDVEWLVDTLPEALVDSKTIPTIKRLAKDIMRHRKLLLGNFVIKNYQYALTYWAVQSIPLVYMKSMNLDFFNVMACAQYVYLKLGYPVLASVITAQPDDELTGRVASPAYLKADVITKLSDQYHHFPLGRSTSANDAAARSVPKCINQMVNLITEVPLVNYLSEQDAKLEKRLSNELREIRPILSSALLQLNEHWATVEI